MTRVNDHLPQVSRRLAIKRSTGRVGLLFIAPLAALVLASTAQAGPPPVLLATADGFAVLAGSTITNTGNSVISGDVGLHPGTAVIGFPPGVVNGSMHVTDAVAEQAKADLVTAYNDAAGRPLSATSPPDIGGQTLTAGVYKTGSVPSLGLTGNLTLDAQGDPGAVFIFQAASTLVTATDSSVTLVNGARACNVYWQIGSSATLGTRTAFKGTIMALTSISANDGVTVDGRLLARNGAVTLINDTITRSRCAGGAGGDTGGGGAGETGGDATGGATGGGGQTGGGTAGGGTGSTQTGGGGGGTAGGGTGSRESSGGSAGGGAQTGGGTSRAAKIGGAKIGGDTAAGDNGGGQTSSGTATGDTAGGGRGERSGSSEQGSTLLTGPNLPFTGLDIRILALGLVLFLSGVALRRRALRHAADV